MPMPKRFLHHANAVALGGRILRPFHEVIDSQASAVLPITGGHGSARVENFRFRDIASFKAAYSTVIGNETGEGDGEVHHGLATVTVEGLNVGNGVVTADAVVARLTSRHEESLGRPPRMRPVGSYFVNLRIAGELVELKPRDDVFRTRELDDVKSACDKRAAQPVGQGSSYRARPYVLTSLFDLPDAPCGCNKADRDPQDPQDDVCWGIKVPGFGTVYIGEFFATEFSRRLSMLRIEMGSPVKGTVTTNIVEGNGSPYP
jgi:hypothetical protein